MLDENEIALLVKVFSSIEPFPHSSRLPTYVREKLKGMRIEYLTETHIGKHLHSLTDDGAKGRYMARWNWWRYKEIVASGYFQRQALGLSEEDAADQQQNPKYHEAEWDEEKLLVETHWQELDAHKVGSMWRLIRVLDSVPFAEREKIIDKYVNHVKEFFAQKLRDLEEKKDIAKTALMEHEAKLRAGTIATQPSPAAQAGSGHTTEKARAAGRKKAKVTHTGDRKKIRAEVNRLAALSSMTKKAACEQVAEQTRDGFVGIDRHRHKLSASYNVPELTIRDVQRITDSDW